MVKHTQIIRREQPTICLSVFDYFVGLALKGLKILTDTIIRILWYLIVSKSTLPFLIVARGRMVRG